MSDNDSFLLLLITRLWLSVLLLMLVEEWGSGVKFTATICDNALEGNIYECAGE